MSTGLASIVEGVGDLVENKIVEIKCKDRNYKVYVRERLAYSALEEYEPEVSVRKCRIEGIKLQNKEVSYVPDGLLGLRYLRCCDLSNTKITSVRKLGKLGLLSQLSLANTPFEDSEELSGITGLSVVDLSGTNVSDLQWMKRMPVLQEARLSKSRITDLSGAEGALFLKKLVLYNSPINWDDPASQRQLLYLRGRGVEVEK